MLKIKRRSKFYHFTYKFRDIFSQDVWHTRHDEALRVYSVRFYTYPSCLLHWHWGNHMIAPVPVKQTWRICVKHNDYVPWDPTPHCGYSGLLVSILKPEQNGGYVAECIFLKEIYYLLIKLSLKFIHFILKGCSRPHCAVNVQQNKAKQNRVHTSWDKQVMLTHTVTLHFAQIFQAQGT